MFVLLRFDKDYAGLVQRVSRWRHLARARSAEVCSVREMTQKTQSEEVVKVKNEGRHISFIRHSPSCWTCIKAYFVGLSISTTLSKLCLCGEQTEGPGGRHSYDGERFTQDCQIHQSLRTAWPADTAVREKIYIPMENLKRTATDVRATGVPVWVNDDE